jgi:membrane protein insertase Oxa1/YidC/SpoIIIJ
MIADIQKKYKDKPEKQQEELLKLQQEYGYKPTAGCMPIKETAANTNATPVSFFFIFLPN